MDSDAKAIRRARLRRVEALLVPITERYGVTTEEVLGPRRYNPLPKARAEIYAALFFSGISVAEIGRLMGKDHTTIIHALETSLGKDVYKRALALRHERPAEVASSHLVFPHVRVA